MKKIYSFFAALIAVLVLGSTASAQKIYVLDESGWDNLALYAWDTSDTPLLGSWPGTLIPTENTETIGDNTWRYYDMSEFNGQTVNIIFNNNGNGKQTSDIKGLVLTRDYYYSLKGNVATEMDDPNEDVPEVEMITIYVENKTGWDPLYCYAYGDNNAWMGGWPGSLPTGETVINGVTYLTFEAPSGDVSENLIFNNGSGGDGNQIPGSAEPTIVGNKDYYFTVTATSCTEVVISDTPTTSPWTIVGSSINGAENWDLTSAAALEADGAGNYSIELESLSGEFKIIKDADWAGSYVLIDNASSYLTLGETVTLEKNQDVGNIKLPLYHTWKGVKVTVSTDGTTVKLLVTADEDIDGTPTADVWTIVGGAINGAASWGLPSSYEFTDDDNDNVYTLTLESLAGEFKIIKNGVWAGSYVLKNYADGEEFTADQTFELVNKDGVGNIKIADDATFSNVTLTLTVSDASVTLKAEAGSVSGIESIEADSNEAVEYYNLQGIKVANPENGLFIRKQGNTVSKVLVK